MTLPLVALFIVVLFAFAALAIDLGILYTARTSAQHAADDCGSWDPGESGHGVLTAVTPQLLLG